MKKKNYLNVFFPFNDNGSGLAPRLRVVVVFFFPPLHGICVLICSDSYRIVKTVYLRAPRYVLLMYFHLF